jgi:pimeloyl-ACP methyl ester carboxylesterase
MRKIKVLSYILLCLNWYSAVAQSRDTAFLESPFTLTAGNDSIFGTLTLSDRGPGGPVVLIIAGSGPTDRNGNSVLTKNNGLQMLARGLANAGIASVRYDKRGVAASMKALKREVDLRFEDYINDAVAWIELLKKDKRFSKIIVAGHSEGSLIGMVAAARAGADKYVSIAGPGFPIDEILKTQLKGNAELYDLAVPVLDSLKQGHAVKKVDLKLFTIARPSIQPYMTSWMKYDPPVEIKKLKIPVLIIQGDNDFQVSVEDAKKLSAALPAAQLLIIKNMNHVLKIIEGDREANAATYKEPMRPLSTELLDAIIKFVGKN